MAKVDVIVRFRPKSRRENLNEEQDPQCDTKRNWISIDERANRISVSKLSFFFHDVIGEEVNQATCFDSSFRKYCHRFIDGRNVTFVAYGPSASGKTYTMFGIGNEHRLVGGALHFGLVPRCVSYLLEQLNESRETAAFQVKCAFVEAYKERLFDLLKRKNRSMDSQMSGATSMTDDTMSMTSTTSTGSMAQGLHMRMATANLDLATDRIQFDNLTSARISSIEDMLRLINIALRKRRWAARYDEHGETADAASLNPGQRTPLARSKSHTVMMMTVKRQMRDGRRMVNYVTFVDLADAPRLAKGASAAEKLEHRVLNQSLLAIGQVTSALHQGKKQVPWKDSTLTKCMYNGLKENGDLCLLLSCSSSFLKRDSTLKSFRFGNLALTDPMLLNILDQLRKEVKSLKEKKPERSGTASDMAEEILHLREDIASYHKEMRRRDKNIEELTGKIAKKELAKAQTDKRLYEKILSERDLRDQLTALTDDLAKAEEEIEVFKQEDADKKERTARLQEEIEELKQQQEEQPGTEETTVDSAEVQRLQQLVSNLQSQLMDAQASAEEAENKVDEQENVIKEKNAKILALESADYSQRGRLRELENELDHLKQNTISKEDNDSQLTHLMSELEARSREIMELHQDVDDLNAVRDENEMLRLQRKELETQLHKFIESSQKQMTANAEYRRMSISPDPMMMQPPNQRVSSQTPLISASDAGSLQAVNEDESEPGSSQALTMANKQVEALEAEVNKLNLDLAHSNDRIRKLEDDKIRLENLTGMGSENVAQKYKEKIAALQERLIMVRTEKATLIPKVNQEKMRLEEKIAFMKRDARVNAIVFKWRSLISKNQVVNLSNDLNHLRDRMDKAYSDQTHARRQLSEFRGMAEKRLEELVHTMPDVEADELRDFHRTPGGPHETPGGPGFAPGLPNDLGKISNYVDDLAKKLDEKNHEIERLHEHIAGVERDLRTAKRETNQNVPSSPRTGSPPSFGSHFYDPNSPEPMEDDFKDVEEDDFDDADDQEFDLGDQIDYLRTTNFVADNANDRVSSRGGGPRISRKKSAKGNVAERSGSPATVPLSAPNNGRISRKMAPALARLFNNISIGIQLDSSYSRVAVDQKTTVSDLINISTGGVYVDSDEAKNVEEIALKLHVYPNGSGEPFTIEREDYNRSVIDMLLDYNILGFAKFHLTVQSLDGALHRMNSADSAGTSRGKSKLGRMFSRTSLKEEDD